jgi:hypothetical protein
MLEPPNNAFSTIPRMPILSPLGEEGFLGKALMPDTGRCSPIFPTAEQPANSDNINLRSQPGDEATVGLTHTNEAGTLHNKTNGATGSDTSGAIDTTSPYKGNLGEAAVGPTQADEAGTLGNETNIATGSDTSGIDTTSAYKSNLSKVVCTLQSPTCPCGLRMESAWSPHRVCMMSTDSVKLLIKKIKTQSVWTPHGL